MTPLTWWTAGANTVEAIRIDDHHPPAILRARWHSWSGACRVAILRMSGKALGRHGQVRRAPGDERCSEVMPLRMADAAAMTGMRLRPPRDIRAISFPGSMLR
jgi:hypothetical protein